MKSNLVTIRVDVMLDGALIRKDALLEACREKHRMRRSTSQSRMSLPRQTGFGILIGALLWASINLMRWWIE